GLALEALVGAGEPAALLADEPARELDRPHPDRAGRVVVLAGRGHAEVALAREIEARIERLEPRQERAAEPRVVERDVAFSAIAPVLKAADDHGAVHEIDHRSRAEGRDHLALPQLALGPARPLVSLSSGHGFFQSRGGPLIQMWTLGSTSRIEVGASTWRGSRSSGRRPGARHRRGFPAPWVRT